jgi:glycerol uptake operon antiterminator
MSATVYSDPKLAYFLRVIRNNPVIACMAKDVSLLEAAKARASGVIIQHATLQNLPGLVQELQLRDKFTLVDVDQLDGIKSDMSGIQYLKDNHVDAIITTRANVITTGKAVGLISVLRCFIVDRKSLNKAMDLVSTLKPDLLEIMPAAVFGDVYRRLEKQKMSLPVLASGLLESHQQVQDILDSGAVAVTTSNKRLWAQPETSFRSA